MKKKPKKSKKALPPKIIGGFAYSPIGLLGSTSQCLMGTS
jgi:hypothetical protein